MAPPSFIELGKLCRDLLFRGYLDGLWRLDCRTLTSPGIHFNTSAQAAGDGKILGFVESKFRVPDTNVFLTGRWHTDNLYFVEAALQDQFAEGLRLALQGRYMATEDEKKGLFLLGYAQPAFRVDMDMTLVSNPIINLSGVLGHQGFLGGYHTNLDTSNNEFKAHNFAVGYVGTDFVLHLGIKDNAKDLLGSLFLRCSDNADVGIEAKWKDGEDSATKVILGTRYRLDTESLVRAKIDNDANLSMGYQRRLRAGVTLLLSCMLQCNDIKSGDHKAGVGLEIEYGLSN